MEFKMAAILVKRSILLGTPLSYPWQLLGVVVDSTSFQVLNLSWDSQKYILVAI